MLRFRFLLLTLLLSLGQYAQALHDSEHVGDRVGNDCPQCLHAQAAHPQDAAPKVSGPLFELLCTFTTGRRPSTLATPLRRNWLARAPPGYPVTVIPA